MLLIHIRPHWEISFNNEAPLDTADLLGLLLAIQDTGSIAQAAKAPAVLPLCLGPAARGRAPVRRTPARNRARARHPLTPLAQKLVWADRRIAARLSPTLESLASELEANWARCARADKLRTIRMDASHGFAVAALMGYLTATNCRSSCATAPAPTPWPRWRGANATWPASTCRKANSKRPRRAWYLRWLDPAQHCLVHLAGASRA
jgi:hypothetical protein